MIALDNVKNVVEMMHEVDETLNSKYGKHKAGMQRSVEIRDAQSDLSDQLRIASQLAQKNKETLLRSQAASRKDFEFENAKRIHDMTKELKEQKKLMGSAENRKQAASQMLLNENRSQ